jgi:hypothetical protein
MEYRVVIYLSGPDADELDAAESRCRAYAGEFNWHVIESMRDCGDRTGLKRLIPRLDSLQAQIILTGTLEMISPDQDTRDGLVAAIERSRCIVHPVCSPCPADRGRSLR